MSPRNFINILLVEDNPGDARLIREMVRKTADNVLQLEHVDTLAGAVDAVKRDPYDIVLLDLGLPDSLGTGTFQRMSGAVGDIPIVVLTGMDDDEAALELIKQGAQDYLQKGGLNATLLQRVVRYSVERADVKRRLMLNEERLRDSNQRFQTVWESVETAVLLIDEAAHTVADANPSACRLMGRAYGDIVNRNCRELVCPDYEGVCPVSDLGQTTDAIQRDMTDADGRVRTVLKTVRPVTFGGRRYLLESLVDISDRKRSEELQRLTGRVLEMLNESYRQVDLINRLTGVIRNGLDAEVVGIRLNDGKESPYYETRGFPGEFVAYDRSQCTDGAQPACMCGAVLRGSIAETRPWFTPGGSFWHNDLEAFYADTGDDPVRPALLNTCLDEGYRSIALVPLRSGVRITGLLLVKDTRSGRFTYETMTYLESIAISIGIALERAQVEKEKVEMRKQLVHAQKMEAVGTLAGGVAHDFNNILTIIQGTADLLLMDRGENDADYEDLMQIKKAGDRAAELTRQLLVFSRKQHMELRPVSLNTSVHEMLKMMTRLIGENIEVRMDLASGLPRVLADPMGVEQLLMNLAVNARDAMADGGTLFIRTRPERFDWKRSESVMYARPGEFVCLAVTDTGTGMDEETASHVFEPFFTTKEQGRGTGLGLSVVYGIVKQHGGWVNLFTEPGHGSTFSVYFPVLQEEDGAEEGAADAGTGDVRGDGERVLLVEDEAGVLEVTRSMLTMNGYRPVTAPDVAGALAVYDAQGPFDLVLTDVVLPDGSGVDLADRIRERQPDARILLCSGYLGNKVRGEQIRERGYPFLAKPFTIEELLRKVRESLGAVESA